MAGFFFPKPFLLPESFTMKDCRKQQVLAGKLRVERNDKMNWLYEKRTKAMT